MYVPVTGLVVVWDSALTVQTVPAGSTQGLWVPHGGVAPVPCVSLVWSVMTFAPMEMVDLVCQRTAPMAWRPV